MSSLSPETGCSPACCCCFCCCCCSPLTLLADTAAAPLLPAAQHCQCPIPAVYYLHLTTADLPPPSASISKQPVSWLPGKPSPGWQNLQAGKKREYARGAALTNVDSLPTPPASADKPWQGITAYSQGRLPSNSFKWELPRWGGLSSQTWGYFDLKIMVFVSVIRALSASRYYFQCILPETRQASLHRPL